MRHEVVLHEISIHRLIHILRSWTIKTTFIQLRTVATVTIPFIISYGNPSLTWQETWQEFRAQVP